MTCCDPNELSRYIDGDLPFPERGQINHHLRRCEACSRELARLREMDGVLRGWGARRSPLPVTADVRITQTVHGRRRAHRVWAFFAVGRMAPAAVGSSIAAVLVVLSVNMHGAYPTRSPSETAWATQQSSIKRQAAPLLKARRSSAILGGQVKVATGTLGRHTNSSELN
jgi:anti-sigma factor RsiW